MGIKITAKQLENWLSQPEYSIPNIILTRTEKQCLDYIAMEKSNAVLGNSFQDVIEKWLTTQNRIPTPAEFIEYQMIDIRKNFKDITWKKNFNIFFKLTPVVVKGIKHRLLRSYLSILNEMHTESLIQDLYPNAYISRSNALDFAGIDILAKDLDTGVEHKIHVTKNTGYSIDYLFKKENKELEFRGYQNSLFARPNWKKAGIHSYSKRDFTGHTFLLYDSFESDSTRLVNGYPLFKSDYIKNKLDVNNELRKGA